MPSYEKNISLFFAYFLALAKLRFDFVPPPSLPFFFVMPPQFVTYCSGGKKNIVVLRSGKKRKIFFLASKRFALAKVVSGERIAVIKMSTQNIYSTLYAQNFTNFFFFWDCYGFF